jgi:hypothetical protein
MRMNPAKLWNEDMQARFPKGMFRRITAAQKDDETRTDFVRKAVEPPMLTNEGHRELD